LVETTGTANKFDVELFERFRKFTDVSTNFSREVAAILDSNYNFSSGDRMNVNLFLAKTVFSKWSIEILSVLYALRSASFHEIEKNVKGIAPRVLSSKLRTLEEGNMVKRTLMNTWPPRAIYSLTERGLTVAKLGEPVLLYTALTQGLVGKEQQRELPLQH
jgi:DNA-binding HxlR family transcriptional regulator